MDSLAAPSTITVTVRHPDGTVTLRVPTDLPLGELMPDFLDVIGQPNVDGWVLSPDGGAPTRIRAASPSSASRTARCWACIRPPLLRSPTMERQ
jgi:hypothetical protein